MVDKREVVPECNNVFYVDAVWISAMLSGCNDETRFVLVVHVPIRCPKGVGEANIVEESMVIFFVCEPFFGHKLVPISCQNDVDSIILPSIGSGFEEFSSDLLDSIHEEFLFAGFFGCHMVKMNIHDKDPSVRAVIFWCGPFGMLGGGKHSLEIPLIGALCDELGGEGEKKTVD